MKVEELHLQPLIVIIYQTGNSGEFFAHALTESFDEITKTSVHWENKSRCKYSDYFGRSLTYNNGQVDHDYLISRTEEFLSTAKSLRKYHIGLAHPMNSSVQFIKNYLYGLPIIEITRVEEISQKFAYQAKYAKVSPDLVIGSSQEWRYEMQRHTMSPPNYLKVEWSDLILDNTEQIFQKIQNFLNITGNQQKFKELVEDYKHRNHDLLERVYAMQP